MENTSDPEMLEIKKKILDSNQLSQQANWEFLMSNSQGRAVMWDLMKHFGLFKYCFDSNGSKMGEAVAKQGCAIYIKNQIAFYVGGVSWVLMEKEAMERDTIDAAEQERAEIALSKQRKQQPK